MISFLSGRELKLSKVDLRTNSERSFDASLSARNSSSGEASVNLIDGVDALRTPSLFMFSASRSAISSRVEPSNASSYSPNLIFPRRFTTP